jgi:hypothetical protein
MKTERVARIGEIISAHKILDVKLHEKRPTGRHGIYEMIILKWVVDKQSVGRELDSNGPGHGLIARFCDDHDKYPGSIKTTAVELLTTVELDRVH